MDVEKTVDFLIICLGASLVTLSVVSLGKIFLDAPTPEAPMCQVTR